MQRVRARREANLARYATLAGGTVLASTSGYLLFILATKFPGDSCTWCLASAALSAAVFGCALRGFSARSARPQHWDRPGVCWGGVRWGGIPPAYQSVKPSSYSQAPMEAKVELFARSVALKKRVVGLMRVSAEL